MVVLLGCGDSILAQVVAKLTMTVTAPGEDFAPLINGEAVVDTTTDGLDDIGRQSGDLAKPVRQQFVTELKRYSSIT